MTIIITITAKEIGILNNNFYDYSGEDRILRNVLNDDYEVFYSGQNQGRLDYQIIDAVNNSVIFRVYYRKKSNSPFIFLGSTNHSSIIKERTIANGINSQPNERLQIRLVIPKSNISNIKINTEFKGIGKYKKSILKHSEFDIIGNLLIGFYKN